MIALLRRLLCAAALLAALPAAAQFIFKYDVPYVPTPYVVVEEMLRLARVGPVDFLIDLGSGDGRIPIAAAKKFGTRAAGVELDEDLLAESAANLEAAGVGDRVTFYHQDLFTFDIGRATVVTMYLVPSVNMRVLPKLLKELKPGTRILSHDFELGDWKPDAKIAQKFQEVDGLVRYDKKVASLWNPKLEGDRVSFVIVDDSQQIESNLYCEGRVAGDTIEGVIHRGVGAGETQIKWRAVRIP